MKDLDINTINLVGVVIQAPRDSGDRGESSIVEFRIKNISSEGGKAHENIFDCKCYGKVAEHAMANVREGDRVAVVGRARILPKRVGPYFELVLNLVQILGRAAA